MEDVNRFGCVNNSIRLRSGIYFDLAEPDPKDVRIDDIAGALSKIHRFGGQADGNMTRLLEYDSFYSVAEHSVACADVAIDDGLPDECVRAVLLHDAAEAYIGDMVRPLKIMIPQFREIEGRVSDAIAAAFSVDFGEWKSEIKEIDNAIVIAERNALFTPDAVEWTGETECRKLDIQFSMWLPSAAERAFLTAFRSLFKGFA